MGNMLMVDAKAAPRVTGSEVPGAPSRHPSVPASPSLPFWLSFEMSPSPSVSLKENFFQYGHCLHGVAEGFLLSLQRTMKENRNVKPQ